jgi:hypothetical protein
MYLNILNKDQVDLLPFLAKFKREFYMVGGTSISLHIGHRKSIDFGMFKQGDVRARVITKKFEENNQQYLVTLNIQGQLNLICRDVKFTFFDYGFNIPHDVLVDKYIKIPNLLDLAAMKAYALGHRSKWKDYVDLYFIIKDYFSIADISVRANEIYSGLFSEKLFRGQLGYFVGINYSEQVELMPGFEIPEEEVKAFLIEASLTGF